MTKVEDIAEYVLIKLKKDNIQINPLELQRILFFIKNNSELIEETAKENLPYFDSVYYKYCFYGIFPIMEALDDDKFDLSDAEKKEIDSILKKYKKKNNDFYN